jgi:hypothetical protein
MDAIKNPEVVEAIKKKTGCENPVGDGLQCPHCGAWEAYKNPADVHNTNIWYWIIRAFKIDDWSECRNCGKWFRC